MSQIIDSYSESNQNSDGIMSSTSSMKYGQSFTGDGGVLNSVKFYLKKVGSPTGNAIACIYAHSGIFGETSIPTGSPLATSDVFDVSALTTSYQLITFLFSRAEKITLTNESYYIVTIEYAGGGGSVQVICGYDNSSPIHNGNLCVYDQGLTWYYDVSEDLCFYVYKDIISPLPTFFRQ